MVHLLFTQKQDLKENLNVETFKVTYTLSDRTEGARFVFFRNLSFVTTHEKPYLRYAMGRPSGLYVAKLILMKIFR